jgi:acetyl-CoA carboxylase carboxyltransferase component
MPVAAFSQDFTVAAGTLGKMHARRIVDVTRVALKNGIPLVAFKNSGRARIPEGIATGAAVAECSLLVRHGAPGDRLLRHRRRR